MAKLKKTTLMTTTNLTTLPYPVMLVPFAKDSTLKFDIPVTSDQSDGKANLTNGFSALNMTSISTGGIPPWGQDLNGILYLLSTFAVWSQAGNLFTFNQDFVTANGGYDEGAILTWDNAGVNTPVRSMKANNTDDFITDPTFINNTTSPSWYTMSFFNSLQNPSVLFALNQSESATLTVPAWATKAYIELVPAAGGGGGTGGAGGGGGTGGTGGGGGNATASSVSLNGTSILSFPASVGGAGGSSGGVAGGGGGGGACGGNKGGNASGSGNGGGGAGVFGGGGDGNNGGGLGGLGGGGLGSSNMNGANVGNGGNGLGGAGGGGGGQSGIGYKGGSAIPSYASPINKNLLLSVKSGDAVGYTQGIGSTGGTGTRGTGTSGGTGGTGTNSWCRIWFYAV